MTNVNHPGELGIGDLAAQTGVAAGTIRMWERRYGFPQPQRTASGYRRYSEDDVEAVRRVAAERARGLSLPAALERARATESGPSDRPSLFAAVASADDSVAAHSLRKATLLALSRAIEDEALARASRPVVFGAFQQERFYRTVEHRYHRLARRADATVVMADFPRLTTRPDGIVEAPIQAGDAIQDEWAVVVDAPGYAACLAAWEQPGRANAGGPDDARRRFEAVWTLDAGVTRRASLAAARLAGRADPELGRRLETLLEDRPLAMESPTPGLTALTNRVVAYLEKD